MHSDTADRECFGAGFGHLEEPRKSGREPEPGRGESRGETKFFRLFGIFGFAMEDIFDFLFQQCRHGALSDPIVGEHFILLLPTLYCIID